MARKNRTPEETARSAKIRELLQESNINSMEDIQNLFKETIAEFMENELDAELDEELGYSKYDYRNKGTDNSRNGHGSKMPKTNFGEVEVSAPRNRKGEFEPHLLKKHQTSISQDIEEIILSMYAKGMTADASEPLCIHTGSGSAELVVHDKGSGATATSDIKTYIRDIYGLEVSDTTVSRITDKILPIIRE